MFTRWAGRCAAVIFISNCILALWSLTVSEFVTSSFGQQMSVLTALAMAAVMGIWSYVDPVYASDTPERSARLSRAPVLANPVARALLVGAFTGLLTFEAFSGAVLEFWTLAFGRQSEQTMHLGEYHNSSRSNCEGFDLQEAPFKSRRVICVGNSDAETHSPGATVIVHGPASAVGIKVERFQISSEE
jgi:hypothetical protein